MDTNSATKDKIMQAAKELIFCDGRFNATTEEIAQKAAVTRTVIHYYYRSMEKLFFSIYDDALEDFLILNEVLHLKNLSLKEKVSTYIVCTDAILSRYPFRDIYLITYIMKSQDVRKISLIENIKDFLNEIQIAISEKKVAYKDPVAFLTDMISLTAYPYVINILLSALRDDNNSAPESFESRKSTIMIHLFGQ